jgi:hypothetical protein
MVTGLSTQGVWNVGPLSPLATWLGKNARREFSSTTASIHLTEGDSSPDLYWICDPASFGFASGASHDPIEYLGYQAPVGEPPA